MVEYDSDELNWLQASADELLQAGKNNELVELLDRSQLDNRIKFDRNYHVLMRYYYEQAGAYAKSVEAARRIVDADNNATKWDQVSSRTALARILCKASVFEESFQHIAELSDDPYVVENYDFGLARQVVQAAIELSACEFADKKIRVSALTIAEQHLIAGCSVTLALLQSLLEAATRLGATNVVSRFAPSVESLRKEIYSKDVE